MTTKSTTKTPPASKAETVPLENPARVRPKLSLHYGAKPGEARK